MQRRRGILQIIMNKYIKRPNKSFKLFLPTPGPVGNESGGPFTGVVTTGCIVLVRLTSYMH